MKDRISQYPNRIGLTDENGVKKYYTLSREDNPTQEGTKLNKANLLSDDTSTRLGFENDATVNDALSVLASGGGYLFGDVQLSTNSYIGDEWLYCNGYNVNAENYPKLVEKYGIALPFSSELTDNNNIYTNILYSNGYSLYKCCGIEKINNEYVCYGVCSLSSGSTYYTFFLTSTDIKSTQWDLRVIAQQNSYYFMSMDYVNGKFVAMYRWSFSDTTNVIYYLNNFKTDTSWTSGFDISALDNNISCTGGVKYGNGYYMITFVKSYNNLSTIYILTGTDITSTSSSDWTLSYISGANATPYHLDFINGYFVVSGRCDASSTYYSAVAWKQNLNDNWMIYNQSSQLSNALGDVRIVSDANGNTYALQLNSHYMKIYNFSFSSGMGSLITTTGEVYNGLPQYNISTVYIDEDYIISTVLYTNLNFVVYDRHTNATYVYSPSNATWTSGTPDAIALFKVGHEYTCLTDSYGFCYYNDSQVTLPIISVSGTYAFIKAK